MLSRGTRSKTFSRARVAFFVYLYAMYCFRGIDDAVARHIHDESYHIISPNSRHTQLEVSPSIPRPQLLTTPHQARLILHRLLTYAAFFNIFLQADLIRCTSSFTLCPKEQYEKKPYTQVYHLASSILLQVLFK